MNSKISFQERAKSGMEILSNRLPVTLEQMKAQVRFLQEQNSVKEMKIKSKISKFFITVKNYVLSVVKKESKLQ